MVRAKRGGKRIELVRLENDSKLQVTFSKRKHTLFKKASELGHLCGAEIRVIIFSSSQKVFSFGNPDIRSIVNSFKNHHHPLRLMEDDPNPTIQSLRNKLTQESAKLEMEIEKEKCFNQVKNMREETENWWNKTPDQLDVTQTDSLIKALEDLKMELKSQQSQPFQPQSYYGGIYNNMGTPNHGSI